MKDEMDMLQRAALAVHRRCPTIDIDELVDEGWLWLRRQRYPERCSHYLFLSLRDWAMQETRGFNRYWRKQGVRRTSYDEVPDKAVPSQIPTIEDQDLTRRLLRGLPRRAAEIVGWHCQGATFEEIGRSLRLTGEGARRVYHRALKQLRQDWAA